MYHDKRVSRVSSHLYTFSKEYKDQNIKKRLIKRRGDVAVEELPVPDEKLMDLIHRATIGHCQSAYTMLHGKPFYYKFEASGLMAFAVLVEELLSEYANGADNEDNENEETMFIQ